MLVSEALRLRQLACEQNANESNTMALIADETSFGRQTYATEMWAVLCCAECDPGNIYWQICDTIIENRSTLNLNIANFTKNAKPASIEDETNKEAKVSTNDVVILSRSLDDNSFFRLSSLTPKKTKKAINSKQRDNVLML